MFDTFSNRQTSEKNILPFGLDKDPVTRLWITTSLFMLATFVVLLSGYLFDTRLFEGASIWAKPMKFSLSLAIHFFTLAILAQQLSAENRNGKTLTIVAFASVIAGLFEQIYISIQAGRGVRSHFNIDTQFTQTLYQLMGVGAVLLISASCVLGIMIWKYANRNDSGFRLGSILGLILGSVLTLVYAGYLSQNGANTVGEPISYASKVPLLGWSRTLGDLRIPHFVATHMMQLLPVTGLLADKFLRQKSRIIVVITTAILALLSMVLFALALSAKPLF